VLSRVVEATVLVVSKDGIAFIFRVRNLHSMTSQKTRIFMKCSARTENLGRQMKTYLRLRLHLECQLAKLLYLSED